MFLTFILPYEVTIVQPWKLLNVCICIFQGIGGVSFTAYSITNNNKPSSGSLLKFSSVFTNQGNAYSTATGKFTTPYNGTYSFSSSLTGYYNSGSEFRVELVVDSSTKVYTREQFDYSSNWEQVSFDIVLPLKVGQKVWIEIRSSNVNFQNNDSTFSGFLTSLDP